jgi:hypothetical protein
VKNALRALLESGPQVRFKFNRETRQIETTVIWDDGQRCGFVTTDEMWNSDDHEPGKMLLEALRKRLRPGEDRWLKK